MPINRTFDSEFVFILDSLCLSLQNLFILQDLCLFQQSLYLLFRVCVYYSKFLFIILEYLVFILSTVVFILSGLFAVCVYPVTNNEKQWEYKFLNVIHTKYLLMAGEGFGRRGDGGCGVENSAWEEMRWPS